MQSVHKTLSLLSCTIALLFCVGWTPPAQANGNIKAQEAFKVAWNRVNAGLPDLPDPPVLKHYAIYPYLQAARLQRDLSQGQPGTGLEIRQFLAKHGNRLVTRQLRLNWLAYLAKHQQWNAFLHAYRPRLANAKLRCNWFAAQIELKRTSAKLARQIQRAYVRHARQPQACDVAYDWLRNTHRMTIDMIARRAYLALRADNASLALKLAGQLPSRRAAPIRQWARLIKRPATQLVDLIKKPQQSVSDDAVIASFTDLAVSKPLIAQLVYTRFLDARKPAAKLRDAMTRALALGMAWSRLPDATRYFADYRPKPDDTNSFIWRVRSALWNDQWNDARRWLAAMPRSLADQPEWVYWRARVIAHFGDEEQARTLYRQLLKNNSYYSLLAADRLNQGFHPQTERLSLDPKLNARLLRMPGVIRAHELFEVGLYHQARREWRAALNQTSPGARLQAIHLAMKWGWYQQAVATATAQGVFDDYRLLYPRPYPKAVATAVDRSGLPSDWIYAVMRQESLYQADARSHANAYGLMQLRLGTAREVARRNNLTPPVSAQVLYDPKINLILGASLLKNLMNRFDNRLIVALAAYNAGSYAIQGWLPQQPLSADIWIANIPYNETRQYIRRILWRIAVFGWRRTGQPQTVANLLTPVTAPTNVAAN